MKVAAPVPRDTLELCLPNRGRFSSLLGNSSFPLSTWLFLLSISEPTEDIAKKVVKERYQSTLWVLGAMPPVSRE